MHPFQPSHHSATFIFSTAVCLATLAATIPAYADDSNWIGTDTPYGDWLDPANWQGGLVPNHSDLYAIVNNFNTARLGPGESSTNRVVYLGRDQNGFVYNGGGLIVHQGVLYTDGITLYGTSSLVLDDATLLASDRGFTPSIGSRDSISTTVDFLSGDYTFYSLDFGNNTFGQTRGVDVVTAQPSVNIDTEIFRIGDRTSDATWTQNDGSLSISTFASVGADVDARGVVNLNYTTVDSNTLLLGYVHPADPIFDGLGTINQTGGSWTTQELEITGNGRFNLQSGSVHVDSLFHGAGTFDFMNQASALNLGADALVDLRDLSVLNAGQASVTGGQNGVLLVGAGYDPSSVFGSFTFGGLVLETGAPVHVQTGQSVALSGIINEAVLIEGTLNSREQGLFLKGPTTIRGELNINSGALIVDGHTSTLESGVGNFFAIIGDGAAESRLELTGGEIQDGRVTVRSINGGVAEVVLDGTVVTDQYFGVLLSGDGTSEKGGRFIQRGGELNVGGIDMGYTNTMPDDAELNQVIGIKGGTSEYVLEEGGLLRFAPQTAFNYRQLQIGAFGGNGVFTHLDGSVDARSAQLFLGRHDETSGVYHLHAGDMQVANLFVGYQGSGRFYQDNGSVIVDGELLIGDAQVQITYDYDPETGEEIIVVTSGGDGLYRITGGSLTAGRISVSKDGKGVFEQDGGTVQTPLLYIGESTQTAGLAEYRLDAGLLAADHVIIAKPLNTSGTSSTRGKLIQTGGTADLGLVQARLNGPYELYGGQANIHRGLILEKGTLDLSDGDASLHILSGAYANFSDGIILGGENATFTADADTLVSFAAGFDLAQLGTFSSQGLVHIGGQELVIPGGTTISAAGSIDGGITNGGTLEPGSSPGSLFVNGGFVQSAAAELVIEIGNPETVGHDQLSVSGAVVLDGHLSVLLYDGFAPGEGDDFAFLFSSDVTGQFANMDNGRVYLPGGSFGVVYNPNNDTLWLTNFQAGLAGDLNHDDAVDQTDLNLLLTNWGRETYRGELAAGDWSGDGRTDFEDLQVLLRNWTAQAAPSYTVPEPSGLALVGLAGFALFSRRCN